MTTLADAAALVPQKEPEPDDDLLSASPTLASMGLDKLLEVMVVPREDEQETLEWTFEGLGDHFGKRKEDSAFLKFIGEFTIQEDDDDDREDLREAEERHKGKSFIAKAVHWLFKRVIKWGFKQVMKLALRAIRWVIREVVVRGVEMVIDFLIRPVLTGVLEFIGVNPELWPVVAVLGGAAALAWLVWDKLFKNGGPGPETPVPEDEIPDYEGETVAAQGNRAVAAAPEAAGGVSVGSAPSSLGDLISRGEGSYNSVNLGAAHGYKASTMNLEEMSVADIQRGQRNHDFNAVGRYQIIGSTLDAAVKALRLTGYEKFDRALQDRIFNEYLIGQKRHAIADYISGKSDDLAAAILAASQEWASVAAPAGSRLQNGGTADGLTSYYAGTANNKASISAAEMANILKKERAGRASSTQLVDQQAAPKSGVAITPTSATGSQLGQAATPTQTMEQPEARKTVIKDKNGALVAVNA
jgi:hypothetical protein